MIRENIHSKKAHCIYKQANKRLLSERIQDARKQIDFTSTLLYQKHLYLSSVLSPYFFDVLDRITSNQVSANFDAITTRQRQKFSRLEGGKRVNNVRNADRVVVNHSDLNLTPEMTSVLSKGLNFAVAPKSIPVEEIITGVEMAIRHLPSVTAEEIRQKSVSILKKSKPPCSNISRGERLALKTMKNDPNILILPADKGNATVVLNTQDYNAKIESLLVPEKYKVLAKDPTSSIQNRVNHLLEKIIISDDLRKGLKANESVAPRLYGLPKIHKTGVPLRPIVSTIGSPTYHLAKYLARLLNCHVGNSDSFIRNSSHFIELLHNIDINPEDILVSFDVTSLFTEVPLDDTLTLLEKIFSVDMIQLFSFCLGNSYFVWNDKFYEQLDGVAMGSPLSPVIANFYMEYFEKEAISTASLKPSYWYRYVDDIFAVWPHGRNTLNEFLQHLNGQHDNIKFTMEIEQDNKLPFLDILITRNTNNNTFTHSVYRKPTHTGRYLNAKSHHHYSQKQSVLSTLVHRAKSICDESNLNEELSCLYKTFKENGYQRKDIERAMKLARSPSWTSLEMQVNSKKEKLKNRAFLPFIKNTTDGIGRILKQHGIQPVYRSTGKIAALLRNPKQSQDPLKTAGVYKIPCECGAVYIGETLRSIKTRITEHERHLRLNQPTKSAVAQHGLEFKHEIQFKDTTVLHKCNYKGQRKLLEAISIMKNPDNFNREDSVFVPRAWHPLLILARD